MIILDSDFLGDKAHVISGLTLVARVASVLRRTKMQNGFVFIALLHLLVVPGVHKPRMDYFDLSVKLQETLKWLYSEIKSRNGHAGF